MLEARSLTKYYGHTAAVRHVSFTVKPGEILGYLGPNGAGKSTTVKMLTGLIEPSEGQIFYRGRSVYRSEEHTSELQSLRHLVCRLLLEKKRRQGTVATSQLLRSLRPDFDTGSCVS